MEVTVLNTGGTISSILKNDCRETKEDFLDKEIDEICYNKNISIKNINIMDKLSENMVPNDWLEIANQIPEDSDRILITHGTDTMIYSLVTVGSIYGSSNKKIIFTGSLNSLDHPESDVEVAIESSIDALINDNVSNNVYLSFRSSNNHEKAELHESDKVKPMYFDEKSFSSLYGSKVGEYNGKWDIINNPGNDKNSFNKLPNKINKELVDIIKIRPGF